MASTKEKSGCFPYWIIFVIIFVLILVLLMFMRLNNPPLYLRFSPIKYSL